MDDLVCEPKGPWPESALYIWGDRSKLYCKKAPLPVNSNDNNLLSGRDIASLRNAGYSLPEIVATIPVITPKRELKRKAGQADQEYSPKKPDCRLSLEKICKNRFSKRDQDWREKNGIFCKFTRTADAKRISAIYNVLQYMSTAQLFHVSSSRQQITFPPNNLE